MSWVSLVAVSMLAQTAEPLPTAELEAVFTAGRRQATLAEVIQLADKNNQDLAAARASAQQIAEKARLTLSAVLPEITASLSYVHTSAEQKFDPAAFLSAFEGVIDASIRGAGPAYGIATPPNEAVLQQIKDNFNTAAAANSQPVIITARNSLYGNLIITQTLFTPQLFLLPAADKSKDAAKLGSQEAREQVMLGIARLYLGIEGISDIEQAAKEAEQIALKREKDAANQQAMGVATEIAVLRAQSETAQARATLSTLQGQKVALLAMLEALVGEAVRPVEGAASHFEVTAGSEESKPWEARFEVRANALGLEVQETFNTFDRLAWLPSIVAQAKGSYNSNKAFAGTNWILDGVIAAQWTLYDRGQRDVARKENDAKTIELRARYEGSRSKAKANWIGAKTNLLAAQVSLKQAESQASLAARAQKQIDSVYQQGFTTSLEVSDLDNRRFFAMSAAAQARSQVEVRRLELAAAEGRLVTLLGISE